MPGVKFIRVDSRVSQGAGLPFTGAIWRGIELRQRKSVDGLEQTVVSRIPPIQWLTFNQVKPV